MAFPHAEFLHRLAAFVLDVILVLIVGQILFPLRRAFGGDGIFMLLLANKRELMGKHVNSRFYNLVAGVTAAVMIVLSAVWIYMT